MSTAILIVDDNTELVAVLTSLFEEAGYSVTSAARGKLAIDAAKVTPPHLAVIDILLPDMMGHHVAETLRAAAPTLPIVFISGVFKGTRHVSEAMARFSGAEYFEKPFDAKKLIASVRRLAPLSALEPKLSRYPTGHFEIDLSVDVDDVEGTDAMELTGRIKVTGGGAESAELNGSNLVAEKPTRGPIPGDRPVANRSAPIPVTRTAKQGPLTDNLPGLITAFYLSKETGELHCQRGKVKKIVYFEAGQPVFALSNLAADRFGQFLVRVGKIRPEQLQDAAVVAAQTKRRTGDVLVERGLLTDSERLYYVGQQVKSIIYSLFGWEDGTFMLTFREKARAESIKLDVFPGTIVMRGIKKLYRPERLARIVQPEDRLMPHQQPPYQLHEIPIDPWEAKLLPRLDGTRTNAEILALQLASDAQVRAFLAAMLGLQLLERRET